jgi:hypothetical protein
VGKLEITSKKQKILPSCGRKALLEMEGPAISPRLNSTLKHALQIH